MLDVVPDPIEKAVLYNLMFFLYLSRYFDLPDYSYHQKYNTKRQGQMLLLLLFIKLLYVVLAYKTCNSWEHVVKYVQRCTR